MELKTEFEIGDTAFCAVRFSEFAHDDRLPVAEVKINAIRFSGIYWGDGNDGSKHCIDYRCTELPEGWQELSLNESELFKTIDEAKAAAAIKLKASLKINQENRAKIERMLESA